MFFLRNYTVEHVTAGIFGITEVEARKIYWTVTKKVQALKPQAVSICCITNVALLLLCSHFHRFIFKITWPDDWNDDYADHHEIFIVTVDGVHCRIQEREHEIHYRDPHIFSHKFNAAGFDYQLAIAIRDQKLVHIAGPYDAAEHDLTIFDDSGLRDLIPPGKFGLGDSLYGGAPDVLRTKNPNDDPELAKFKARSLARHETFNMRIKQFASVANVWRHKKQDHKITFEAVCIIVQYQIENDSPLFDV